MEEMKFYSEEEMLDKHVVNGLRNIERSQEIEPAVYVCKCAEEPKQQCRNCNAQRFPLTENHDRKCEEAETCNADFKITHADTRRNIGNAAQSSHSSGNDIYTVKKKDTIFGIANKYGLSLPELMDANPEMKREGTHMSVCSNRWLKALFSPCSH